MFSFDAGCSRRARVLPLAGTRPDGTRVRLPVAWLVDRAWGAAREGEGVVMIVNHQYHYRRENRRIFNARRFVTEQRRRPVE